VFGKVDTFWTYHLPRALDSSTYEISKIATEKRRSNVPFHGRITQDEYYERNCNISTSKITKIEDAHAHLIKISLIDDRLCTNERRNCWPPSVGSKPVYWRFVQDFTISTHKPINPNKAGGGGGLEGAARNAIKLVRGVKGWIAMEPVRNLSDWQT
jgi:hypothetical protein